ncbi:MAG: NAD(P)-dependent oxidoreductase [Chloroflexi bacterium]|nr:MAG: NAD(P)-dependent oxidoreductase [Chloroflexota bacterium]
MKAAFIGLGNMGGPMAANIAKAGHNLTVWNRTAQAMEPVVATGARGATSVQDAVRDAEIIGICVSTPDVVRSIVLGDNGVLASAKRDAVIVDFSTIDPATSRSVGEECAKAGFAYLDAPVSGGVTGAAAGTLTVIIGGDEAALERAQPMLQAVGKKIVHVGPSGAGSTIKLINQLLVGVNLAAVSEAFILGQRAGVDPQTLFDVLSTSAADSAVLRRALPDFILKRHFEPGFAIQLLCKDLDLALSVGRESHTALPLTAIARQLYEDARALNLAEKDITAAIKALEHRYGVEVG